VQSGPATAAALQQAAEVGRAAWPKVQFPVADFAAHIGRVLDVHTAGTASGVPAGDADAAAAIASLQLPDLFLAGAAAAGLQEAIAEFEARYMKPLPFILGMGNAPENADTVCAALRAKLLVASAEGPPRIASYGGRGPLAAWVAIAAQRTALSLNRQESALQRAHDRAMNDAMAVDLDPELRHMKVRYKEHVEAAFRDALGELTDRDRALLKLGLVAGLGLEAIGASYNVNASTVSRWLGRIRQTLLERTLVLLRERLRLTEPEAASIARLVTSQIDVSVVRFL
jgi:RNA polymerase sigma-70 factor (ECF subfamily)